MDNKLTIIENLAHMDLSVDEAKVYVELLKAPNTHLEVARATGVNRSKVYRIAEDLVRRGLLELTTNQEGSFLTAKDPSTLEIDLVEQEQQLQNKRDIYQQLLPSLQSLVNQKSNKYNMEVRTYDGVEGLKQMLWHELKAKDEVLVFADGPLEVLTDDRRWSEKFRKKIMEAGYRTRDLLNPGAKHPVDFTEHKEFFSIHEARYIDADILHISHSTAIYNDTVALYMWQEKHKVGVEIINKQHAQMMREMFEMYWALAKKPKA